MLKYWLWASAFMCSVPLTCTAAVVEPQPHVRRQAAHEFSETGDNEVDDLDAVAITPVGQDHKMRNAPKADAHEFVEVESDSLDAMMVEADGQVDAAKRAFIRAPTLLPIGQGLAEASSTKVDGSDVAAVAKSTTKDDSDVTVVASKARNVAAVMVDPNGKVAAKKAKGWEAMMVDPAGKVETAAALKVETAKSVRSSRDVEDGQVETAKKGVIRALNAHGLADAGKSTHHHLQYDAPRDVDAPPPPSLPQIEQPPTQHLAALEQEEEGQQQEELTTELQKLQTSVKELQNDAPLPATQGSPVVLPPPVQPVLPAAAGEPAPATPATPAAAAAQPEPAPLVAPAPVAGVVPALTPAVEPAQVAVVPVPTPAADSLGVGSTLIPPAAASGVASTPAAAVGVGPIVPIATAPPAAAAAEEDSFGLISNVFFFLLLVLLTVGGAAGSFLVFNSVKNRAKLLEESEPNPVSRMNSDGFGRTQSGCRISRRAYLHEKTVDRTHSLGSTGDITDDSDDNFVHAEAVLPQGDAGAGPVDNWHPSIMINSASRENQAMALGTSHTEPSVWMPQEDDAAPMRVTRVRSGPTERDGDGSGSPRPPGSRVSYLDRRAGSRAATASEKRMQLSTSLPEKMRGSRTSMSPNLGFINDAKDEAGTRITRSQTDGHQVNKKPERTAV